MLVELFPTKIPLHLDVAAYHIGNGWFGGLLPATSFAIVASTGDIYAGCGIRSSSHRSPRSRLLLPAGNQGRRIKTN